MEELRTDYKDDVLDAEKNQLRKYQMITNDDGTVSFVDVTNYTTVGTNFGAKDINDTNGAVNELNNSLVETNNSLGNKQDKLINPLTKSDVVNNLTSSATNVPLSANQGKVLNDKISDLALIASYTYESVTISANSTITATPKSNNIPSGYKSVAVSSVQSGQAGVLIRSFNTSGTLSLRNVGGSAITVTPTCSVLCINSLLVK